MMVNNNSFAKSVVVLFVITLAFFTVSVSVCSSKNSTKYYMDKVIANLKKGNVKTVNKYSAKLPKWASEKCVSKMSQKQKKAFNAIIKKEIKKRAGSLDHDVCFVTDIDKDGIAELLVEHGDFEAERVIVIYKYKNGKAKKLKGEIDAYHLGIICQCPGRNGVLFCHYGRASYFTMVSIKNDTIKTKDIAYFDEGTYEIPNVGNMVKGTKGL